MKTNQRTTKRSNLERIKLIANKYWPNEKIKEIKEFEEGFNNVVFRVKTNKRIVVIKIILREDSEINAAHEAHAFELIKKKYPSLPLPKILFFDNKKDLIDKAYMISSYLPGKPLTNNLLLIKNRDNILEQLGEIKAKIHSIKYKKYGFFNKDFEIIKKDPLKEVIKKTEKAITKNKFSQEIKKFWKINKQILYGDNHPCLCQGDAGLGNLLLSEKKHPKIIGILDFEFVHSGHRMNDIITLYNNFERIEEFLPPIIKGYKKYSTLPKNWKKMFYLYSFSRYVREIAKIDKMNFRNKTKKEMKQIRIKVKERCTKYLELIIKNCKES